MRTDPTRDRDFVRAEQWGAETFNILLFEAAEQDDGDGPPFRSAPFSGGERNRLLMRREGNYDDMTLVSGIDFREDGRGFALFDYDRDGFLDIGVVSPNYPRFRIVRNAIGDRQESKNGFVEVQLVGGQNSVNPSSEWSSREPYGATIMVTSGDIERMFQLSCGEGLSSQNTNRIHVGLGQSESIDRIEVKWPSGKRSVQENIRSGERITIFENPEHAE